MHPMIIHLIFTFFTPFVCEFLFQTKENTYLHTKYGNQIKSKSENFGLIGKIVHK